MDKLSIRLVTQSRAFHDLDLSVHCKKYHLYLLHRFEGIQLVGQRYEIIGLHLLILKSQAELLITIL